MQDLARLNAAAPAPAAQPTFVAQPLPAAQQTYAQQGTCAVLYEAYSLEGA
jgi:hypothetical protein